MSKICQNNLLFKTEQKNFIKINKDKKDLLTNINKPKINLKGRNKTDEDFNLIKNNKINKIKLLMFLILIKIIKLQIKI